MARVRLDYVGPHLPDNGVENQIGRQNKSGFASGLPSASNKCGGHILWILRWSHDLAFCRLLHCYAAKFVRIGLIIQRSQMNLGYFSQVSKDLRSRGCQSNEAKAHLKCRKLLCL